jgi:hypothetical protein
VSAVVVAVVNKAGEAVDVEAAATTTVAARNSRGDGSCIPSGGDEEGGGSTSGGDSAAAATAAAAAAARGSSGGPKEEEKGAEAMAVMGSDEFVDVVKKFGSTRAYTSHQVGGVGGGSWGSSLLSAGSVRQFSFSFVFLHPCISIFLFHHAFQ